MRLPQEAEVLRLTSEAAVSQLGWRRRWSLNEADRPNRQVVPPL